MRKIFNNIEFDEFETQKLEELKREIENEKIEIPEEFFNFF